VSLENLRRVGRALQPTTDLDQLADRHEFFDDHGGAAGSGADCQALRRVLQERRDPAGSGLLVGDHGRVRRGRERDAGRRRAPGRDLRRRRQDLAAARRRHRLADGAERVDVDGLCKAIAETTVAT